MNRAAPSRPVSRILILSDLYDLIQWSRLQDRLVKLLYNAYWMLQQLYPDAEISLNDRSGIDYACLWGAHGAAELSSCVTRMRLDDIDWNIYDMVICQPWMEEELEARLADIQTERSTPPTNHKPATFRIAERNSYGIYPSVFDLCLDGDGAQLLSVQSIEHIKQRRAELFPHFLGFDKEKQESAYAGILEKIRQTNASTTDRPIRNVLVLDDHQRKFYLGDACFTFLFSTRRALRRVANAKATINCCNTKVFERLSEMFVGSFGSFTEFTSTSWESFDLNEYDLVLCHPDSILKLLATINRDYPDGLRGTAIYYYDHMIDYTHLVDSQEWSYRLLPEQDPVHQAEKIRQNRLAAADKEIVLPDGERDWADRWLEEQGLLKEEKIAILPEGASTGDKLLSAKTFKGLMEWLVADGRTRILLYDLAGSTTAEGLVESYGPALADRIIVARSLGIRKDMRLLASRYVKAVIGPCTGILHLANGIYTYLINHGRVSRSNMPLLLVYTGNLSEMNQGYNPKNWWLGSLVKCAILTRSGNGERQIKKLGQCLTDNDNYKRISLPVAEYDTELLTGFIKTII